jgi:type VI secretion system secreted protein Hcp
VVGSFDTVLGAVARAESESAVRFESATSINQNKGELDMRIAARAIAFLFATGLPTVALGDIIALQIPTIPGDARFAANNALPPDSIRVLSVGNGVQNPPCDPAGAGGCVGKAIFENISILKKFGESSPSLFLAVARGQHFQTATISFYRMRGSTLVKYFTISLDDVTIASQKWVGNAGTVDSADSENVEISYTRIIMLDNETGARACYDRSLSSQC